MQILHAYKKSNEKINESCTDFNAMYLQDSDKKNA